MALASTPDNIRYGGTGRAYVGAVGGTSFDDLGDLETLSFALTVTSEKVKTNRNAAKATILEVETDREASLTFGLREMSNNNLKMALLADTVNTLNQTASYVYQTDPTLVDDLYIDLGHLNVSSTKLTGIITGTLAVEDTLTGETSGATGKIAFVGSGYVEIVNVVGTFQASEQVYNVEDTDYITPTGIETLEDVIVTDVTGASRRIQGTDYTLDPDYGYIRQLSTGTTAATDVISYDYATVDKQYLWSMASSSVQKRLIFVSDKDDQGPRQRWTFHKVQINFNGDFPLIGAGAAILNITATVLADTTQASGQEYFKTEIIG
jgi:hypothetical protein